MPPGRSFFQNGLLATVTSFTLLPVIKFTDMTQASGAYWAIRLSLL